MRIGLTYDIRDDYAALGWSEQRIAEFDRADTIDAIEAALRARGDDIERIGNANNLVQRLAEGERWDLVFNIAEGHTGVGRESLVPALLDHFGVAYTFSDPLICALTLDKPTTKRVLRHLELPTPEFVIVRSLTDLAKVAMPFPLFVKPSREGSSKGVHADSIVRDDASLRQLCERVIAEFGQPALVERYLPGREATVGVLGTGDAAKAVGALEVIHRDAGEPAVYSYETKERCEDLIEYALATGDFAQEASALAVATHCALGCRDASRVDVRADPSGRLQILEVNALPGLHPSHSDLPIMWAMTGSSYDELIQRITDSALERALSRAAPPLTVMAAAP